MRNSHDHRTHPLTPPAHHPTPTLITRYRTSSSCRSGVVIAVIACCLIFLLTAQPSTAAPLDPPAKTALTQLFSRHSRAAVSADKGCQITSSEIALPLTFTIEMPSYVMIGNHKFNLKLQMPLVNTP